MQNAIMTPDQLAALFGCSREQIIAQYRTVSADMRKDLEKAKAAGKTITRKYPIEKFEALTIRHEELAKQ